MLQRLRSDPLARMLGHTTVVLALSTLVFYLMPMRVGRDLGETTLRTLGTLAGLVLLGLVIRAAVRRSRRVQHEAYFRIQWLLTVLYVLVLGFAFTYAALAAYDPGQFSGVEDRTDALYLSVTLVSTVGFGDIHPTGTAGQVLTIAHMVFNVVYLGTAVRLLSARQPGGPPAAD